MPPFGPKTDKYSILLEDDKVVVGASSMQGWRPTMEDAHTIVLTLPRLADGHEEDGAIFSVFDGHCGSKCAQLCSSNMLHWLTQTESYARGDYDKALSEAFVKGDSALRSTLGEDESGCTAVVALIVKKRLFIASAGDSRALLCKGGKAIALTVDHKPTLPAEKARIEKAGGFVAQNRVNGVLALSRALGDFPLKSDALPPHLQAVSCVPDVSSYDIGADDEFLVLACDGLFEKKTDDEVVSCIRSSIVEGNDPSVACETLSSECLGTAVNAKGSDNMTVITIQFKTSLAGSAFPPQVQKDAETPVAEEESTELDT